MRRVCPEKEDSFLILFFFEAAPAFFLTKGDVMMMERFFLTADSEEMIHRPARMCSPNCLTAPPISTYFASLPTKVPFFFFFLINADRRLYFISFDHYFVL